MARTIADWLLGLFIFCQVMVLVLRMVGRG